MSGLQALENLRADETSKHIPVVVVSGHATVQDAVFLVFSGRFPTLILLTQGEAKKGPRDANGIGCDHRLGRGATPEITREI